MHCKLLQLWRRGFIKCFKSFISVELQYLRYQKLFKMTPLQFPFCHVMLFFQCFLLMSSWTFNAFDFNTSLCFCKALWIALCMNHAIQINLAWWWHQRQSQGVTISGIHPLMNVHVCAKFLCESSKACILLVLFISWAGLWPKNDGWFVA